MGICFNFSSSLVIINVKLRCLIFGEGNFGSQLSWTLANIFVDKFAIIILRKSPVRKFIHFTAGDFFVWLRINNGHKLFSSSPYIFFNLYVKHFFMSSCPVKSIKNFTFFGRILSDYRFIPTFLNELDGTR